MKLIGMMDSPYVRRVAVSLELYGIEFESMQLSVFRAFEAFSQINPVVKAPTLVMDNGVQLMDSTLILQYFDAQAGAEQKLMPLEPGALASDLQILGVILAACEKAVQNIYEHNLRPAEKQHQPWVDRVTQQLLAACREWDTLLEGRPTAKRLDQISVTSAVVWTFIQFMIPNVVQAGDFNHIAAVATSCEALPAFKKYPLC